MNKILKTKIGLAIATAIITFIVFLPALQNDFIMWDDDVYVYENLFIRSFDARLLMSAFTELPTGLWHPLTWISHALDYAAWGLNPLGHHLTNNIIHALNVFIIILLAMRLLEVYRQVHKDNEGVQTALSDRAVIIAGVTAGLLFGIHPLRVESVAWVSERKDLLSAFFFLLTISAYSRYIDKINTTTSPGISSRFFSGNYLSALGLFILALMSKPMAVSLPVVLLILDWHPYKRIRSVESFRTAFIEKIPFIILSLAASIVTLFAQQTTQSISSLGQLPLTSRMVLAVESVVFYLTKIVLLVHLVPVYPNPAQVSIFSLYSVLSLFVLLGITSVCIAKARKQRLWVSILAYYVITLVPVLGIVQVGVVSRADRFTYLPSIGVFLILGLLAAKIEEKIRKGSPWGAGKRMSGYAAAITVAALLSYATISQIGVWKDSIRFWTYVIDAFPGRVPVAHNNLGLTYVQQHRFLEAINEFKTSIEIDKGYISAYGNLGNEYMRMGRYEDAIQEIQTAILIGPDNAKSHNNLGFAYAQLRRYDEALKEYAAALNLDPSLAESYNNLGLLYADLNRIDEAINEYNTALRLKPAYPAALNNLGIAYMSRQRYQEAIHEFTAALALEPGFTAAHYNLGNAYAAIGSLDQAIAEYRAAIALDPYEPDAHTRLSEVYAKQGRLNDAANEMETAGELLKGNSRYVPLVLTQ